MSDAEDLIGLLALVPLPKLESLYGREAVHSQAKAYLQDQKAAKCTNKGRLLCGLHARQCEGLLVDGIIEGVLRSLEAEPDGMLMCPLSMRVFTNPVVLCTGFVVDRESVTDADGHLRVTVCPWTRKELVPNLVYPVHVIREKAQEWRLDRLDEAANVAELLVSQGVFPPALKVFDIAERLLEDVGEQYVHIAKRIADLEWRVPDAKSSPEQAAKIYGRVSRVMGAEERRGLAKEAVKEFIAHASRCLNSEQAVAAALWTEGEPALWLNHPSICDLWDDERQEWCEIGLKVAAAMCDGVAVWHWRRQMAAVLRKRGGLEEWLKREGLTGQENELVVEALPHFEPSEWILRNTRWIDETTGRARVGGSNGFVEAAEDLQPRDGCDWFCEVSFKADTLDERSFHNVVMSKHGHYSGWEIRVCREQGVLFMYTEEGTGHVYISGPQGAPVSLNRWVHVGVAYERQRGVVTLFVNGIGGAEQRVGRLIESPLPCLLGRNPEWRDRQLQGLVAHPGVIHTLPDTEAAIGMRDTLRLLAQRRLSSLLQQSNFDINLPATFNRPL